MRAARVIRQWLTLACAAALCAHAHAQEAQIETYGNGAHSFALATGSPGELGLLKKLAEDFCATNDARMQWHKAGTGQSMKLLKDKRVDMVMVHAPGQEETAVAEGWATQRTLIGSNEFYIVGPAADPAHIAQAGSAAEAYQRIAAAQAKFVSRGDNSGTHQKEMAVWKSAGVAPQGEWYIVTRAFMTASLKRADAEGAYFMTDSSTWVAEKRSVPALSVLFRGDRNLVNTYSAMVAPAGSTPGEALARRFVDYLASPAAQTTIRDFGRAQHGEALYNDAAYARQYAR